ncbi:MAG: hypothetical protein ACE5O2_12870 [Armatimonadota bacterium]
MLRPGGRLLVAPNLKNLQRRLGLPWLKKRGRYPRFPTHAMPGEEMIHWTECQPRELPRLLADHDFPVESLFGDFVGLSLVPPSPRPIVMLGSEFLRRILPGLSNHLIALARKP